MTNASYHVIYYEKFRKVIQRTEKEALSLIYWAQTYKEIMTGCMSLNLFYSDNWGIIYVALLISSLSKVTALLTVTDQIKPGSLLP